MYSNGSSSATDFLHNQTIEFGFTLVSPIETSIWISPLANRSFRPSLDTNVQVLRLFPLAAELIKSPTTNRTTPRHSSLRLHHTVTETVSVRLLTVNVMWEFHCGLLSMTTSVLNTSRVFVEEKNSICAVADLGLPNYLNN